MSGTGTLGSTTLPIGGTAQLLVSPANVATTFNGQGALQGTVSLSGTLVISGQSRALGSSSNFYVNASATQSLGTSSASDDCVVTAYTPPPATAMVGATGPLAMSTCYADSTMTTVIGTEADTYRIAAGTTATNGLVSIISTNTNTANQVTSVTQVDFLIDSAGVTTLKDVKASGTASNGVLVSFTIQ